MSMLASWLKRYGAALAMMALIFAFSSRPAAQLPQFGWADVVVKKGGHVVGYGLLALAYWRALEWNPRHLALAWGMAVLYGATDEFHQLFVAGRHPSPLDVFLFDGVGAALALSIRRIYSASASRLGSRT